MYTAERQHQDTTDWNNELTRLDEENADTGPSVITLVFLPGGNSAQIPAGKTGLLGDTWIHAVFVSGRCIRLPFRQQFENTRRNLRWNEFRA